jgi:hypothetical protein
MTSKNLPTIRALPVQIALIYFSTLKIILKSLEIVPGTRRLAWSTLVFAILTPFCRLYQITRAHSFIYDFVSAEILVLTYRGKHRKFTLCEILNSENQSGMYDFASSACFS